jgi:hypothetical protein
LFGVVNSLICVWNGAQNKKGNGYANGDFHHTYRRDFNSSQYGLLILLKTQLLFNGPKWPVSLGVIIFLQTIKANYF